jgi:selenocysteine lyase/cysteine desulfurase
MVNGQPDVAASRQAMLSEIVGVPEIAALARGVAFSIDSGLDVPFRAEGLHVALAPGSLKSRADAEVSLRHALEVSLLCRVAPERDLGCALALGLLACRVGAIYAFTCRREGRLPASLPPWLARIMTLVSVANVSWRDVGESLRLHGGRLLAMQGALASVSRETIDTCLDRTVAVFEEVREVAAPAEFLLTTGGDTRLQVDPIRGLNNYGCSPRPRTWAFTFASSTATSISESGYEAAEALRQDLLRSATAARLAAAFGASSDATRGKIRELCEFPPDTQVILTTSGTDAELYALFLALLGSSRLHNLIVGVGETGSSVGIAAAGVHFDNVTPLGLPVAKGAPIDPFFENRVVVDGIAVRETDGGLRSVNEVDLEVEQKVDAAVASGSRVLLHVLDVSKTGLLAPSLEVVQRIKARHTDAVDVVIDACQLRVSRDVLASYYALGYMVILTGSKFVTGPPFAGALVVPPSLADRARRCATVPDGLRAYSTMDEWPADWKMRLDFSRSRNVGLLLRWRAALWELEALRRVPAEVITHILSGFGQAISTAIRNRPHLRLVETRPIDRCALAKPGSWDSIQTIFTFTVHRTVAGASERAMSPAALRQVYEWLNQDISGWLRGDHGERDMVVAAKCCHLGQPVVVGRTEEGDLAALRISAGARLVTGVALGACEDGQLNIRLAQEIGEALFILDKLDLIVRDFDALEGCAAVAQSGTVARPGDHVPIA